MVTTEERKVFGWLGKIPDCIVKYGSVQDIKEYKNLADRARYVATMRNSEFKTLQAKEVEQAYYELVDRVQRRLDINGIRYEKIIRPTQEVN